MDWYIITLRILHIAGGVLWAGWTFVLAGFIQPAVRAMGPAGGGFMQALTGKTRLILVMTITPVVVIVSGLLLLWEVSGHLDQAWIMTGHGMSLTIGGILGILVFVFGMSVIRPSTVRMAAIGSAVQASGAPPTPEQAAELKTLQQRVGWGAKIVAWSLLAVVISMSIARYIVT